MIGVTVRTLDSQNHFFEVQDDFTVAQFKQHIAETVNIPAETQRIIYCGRVLNDEALLSEFDVNGKVVHLVERAPPSENARPSGGNRAHSPLSQLPPQHRLLGGNAMYLGSMAIPIEPQNLMPPPPSHSLAASRLNVAKRMLRRAENIINLLENPSARPADVTPPEEPQEDVTPVFEARVIVPTTANEPLDEAFVLNAVQNSLINASITGGQATTSETTASAGEQSTAQQNVESESPGPRSVSSTPEGVSPISTSTEDLAGEFSRPTNQPEGNNGGLAENASRTSEMADLLETLGRLQVRFAPFLETYQNFMRDDPVVNPEDIRRTQAMMNQVSKVLHFLGHAYHSLSDIIIRVRNPPPRPLLCRPILIQHSALLQAGFPIQVEAQINFSPENVGNAATTTAGATSTATTETTTQSNTTTNAGTNAAPNPPQPAMPQARVTGLGPGIPGGPNIFGFPLMPPAGVHVQSFPIGIRAMRPGSGNRPTPASMPANQPNATAPPTTATNTSSASFNNNPNFEIFMEVTPGSVTIDSLETTIPMMGGNQGEGMRGALPPSELIQSIVQMATHFVNRGNIPPNMTPQQPQPAATTPNSTATQAEPTTQATANGTATGQNSQARGNTQTHPTTATHTRSTARPHVHLAQHAMQGFDPFLPCNSHHVINRHWGQMPRPSAPSTNNNQATNNNAQRAANGGAPMNPVLNIMQGVLNSLQNVYTRRGPAQPTPTPAPAAAAAPAAPPPSSSAGQPPQSVRLDFNQLLENMPNFANILPHLQNFNTSADASARTPTIAQLLQQVGDQNQGEGIFNDLIMLLSRNFTIGDMLQLNAGRLDPLLRIRTELRRFIVERILEGNATPANVERGVNRLITEMQPFIDNLSHLQVQHDIDIVRSVQMLFRTRLVNILNVSVSPMPGSMRMLVEQLKILARHLCALILHASSNGQRGVEEVLSIIVTRYMEGITPEVQQWTLLATRVQLQHFMRNLNVPLSSLQPYIVRNVDAVTTPTEPAEPMDLDPQACDAEQDQASGSTSVLGVINLSDNTEELPAVVIGSEPWHGQVPTDWVPIITRDTQRQRRQNQQSPLSDAYLAGMPSKRRKIVTNNKPQGSLPQVIAESIRRAVTSSGLSQIGNLENISQEAGTDLNIQSAYRDLLRTRVQSSIQDNEDFTPDRFPNASNYFNKSQ